MEILGVRGRGWRHRPRAAHVWAIVGLLLVVACGDPPASERSPQRIIAIAPSVTEILFDLGLGERVVGVGDYASWPPQVNELPRLGGLYDTRLETIVDLQPDLAVLIPSERDVGGQLRRLGIDVLEVESDTLAQVESSIGAIARHCGVPEAGEVARRRFVTGLAPRSLPGSPRVVVTVGREAGRVGSVMVAGPGTFADELLRRAGGVNAFADTGVPYPQVGAEELIGRSPVAIVELQTERRSAKEKQQLLADWRHLPGLPAVEDGCLVVIDGTFTVLPGPRLPELYERLATALSRCVEASRE